MNLTNAVSPYLAFTYDKSKVTGADTYSKGCIPNDPISGVHIAVKHAGYLITDPRGFSYMSGDPTIFYTTTIVDGYILEEVVHTRYKEPNDGLGGPVLYNSPLYHKLKVNSNPRIRINTIPQWSRVKFDTQETGYIIGASYLDLRNQYMNFELPKIKNAYTIVAKNSSGTWELRSVRKINKIVVVDETDTFPEAHSYAPYMCKYKDDLTFKIPIVTEISSIVPSNKCRYCPFDPITNLVYVYNYKTRKIDVYDKWNTEYVSKSLYYPTLDDIFGGITPVQTLYDVPTTCTNLIFGRGPAVVI